jgi:hypothetical protein
MYYGVFVVFADEEARLKQSHVFALFFLCAFARSLAVVLAYN